MMLVTADPAAFAAVFAALYAGHEVADHWVQSDSQATRKAAPGWRGHRACASHIFTHTLTLAWAVAILMMGTAVRLELGHIVAGLALNGLTHYIADRRSSLEWLARRTGNGLFMSLGQPRPGHDDQVHLGTGAYALDQAWHIGWLAVSGLIMAGAGW